MICLLLLTTGNRQGWGYSNYNAWLSTQCFDQLFCWPLITFSPMSILLKVKVCKWVLEARIFGAMFSTKSFSMYWPKKGQAWARICHRVKISHVSIFTQPWFAREGTELIASHLIEPFSFLNVWKTDLERKEVEIDLGKLRQHTCYGFLTTLETLNMHIQICCTRP